MDWLGIVISVVSIFLSGVFSWIASYFYYKKASRDSALAQIISQIYALTVFSPDKSGIEDFKQIILKQELNHLKEDEYKLILTLFYLYKEVGIYSYLELLSLILREHFEDVVNQKNIYLGDISIFDDTNKEYIRFDKIEFENIANSIKQHLDNKNVYFELIDEENNNYFQKIINDCLNNILNETFNYYESIDFFEKEKLLDVINESTLLINHNASVELYYKFLEEFKDTFKKEIKEEWSELFIESEGYPF